MRASISGTNGSSRIRLALTPEELGPVIAGLGDPQSLRFMVEGDAAKGLRITAGANGVLAQLSDGHAFVSILTSQVMAEHSPVGSCELMVMQERDDSGPFLLTQPLPAPFVPKEKRKVAQSNLDAFHVQKPLLAAENLFRKAARVRPEHATPVAWTHRTIFADDGAVHSTVAVMRCTSCANEVEVTDTRKLPDTVLLKKFRQVGWWVKGPKCTCPECQQRAHAKGPIDMVRVIDTVIERHKVTDKIAVLKAAIAEVNKQVAEAGDTELHLRIVKGRLELIRISKV